MPSLSLNNVVLAGNLTRDPELRYLNSGTPVAKVSIAVNNRVKKGDQWVDDPCFVDVVVFGKAAEDMGSNADKGQPVLVNGRLQFRTWETDGQRRSKHEVVADRIQAVTGSKASSVREPGSDDEGSSRGRDDDVPF